MKSVFSDSCSRVVPKGIICGNKSLSGLVDVGGTWLCPASLQGEELNHIEQSAILTGLQEKHLTHLYNPRWLKGPLSARGSRDLWTVEIPAELLPWQHMTQVSWDQCQKDVFIYFVKAVFVFSCVCVCQSLNFHKFMFSRGWILQTSVMLLLFM